MVEKKKKKEFKKKKEQHIELKIDLTKSKTDVREMLKNGVHFGHSKSRKDPRMDKYVFGVKRGINIIDLQKTEEKLKEAIEFIKKLRKNQKQILFVGTKKQSKLLLKAVAEKCEMPYIEERWLGGTFTNFSVIRRRAQYLKDSQEKLEKGEFDKYTKLEKLKKSEELEKLEKRMGGIKIMKELPGAVFIVDIKSDNIALREAISAKVPTIALVDTNVNPETVDYPIPANDDATSSVKLMLEYIGTAVAGK
ncbi:MAG TPA: 30S ribosomal protein S2 [Candidatus Moranbacteria bacterium]|nr:30S ribosomal protein S2 [Candidatus Moranbacteria bacterium]